MKKKGIYEEKAYLLENKENIYLYVFIGKQLALAIGRCLEFINPLKPYISPILPFILLISIFRKLFLNYFIVFHQFIDVIAAIFANHNRFLFISYKIVQRFRKNKNNNKNNF